MNRRPTLAASIAGAVVVALDGTVLTVAQPTLQRDLHASFAQVQWTSTGYLVAVAGLLVFAGRLGDAYGHRRTFAVGMLGFGAASAGVAVAPGIAGVIGLRVVQGVFGALLQPATLGMLRAAFPPDRLRGPLAARTAAIGVAAAAGPVLGGALATGFGWRAVFLLNVVPALLFGILALTAPEPEIPPGRPGAHGIADATAREPGRPPGAPVSLDVPGALLLAAALACLVHTVVDVPVHGWSWTSALTATAAITAGVAFIRHEHRTPAPLLPTDVIGAPPVAASLGMLVAASAALNGALFTCVYLLQDGLGLTPLRCALVSLPLAVLLTAAAPTSAVLLRRAGARRTTAAGAAALALGLLLLARATALPVFCTGFALVGAGFGTVMVAATHVVVHRSPATSAGVAGGLQQTAMNIGPVLGVATATVLMKLGGTRSPLVVMALATAAAMSLSRPLPTRPTLVPPGQGDAPHSEHGLETGSFPHSLRNDEF